MVKLFKMFKALSVGVAVFSASIILLVSCGGGGGGLSGTTWQADGAPFELSFDNDGKYVMKGGGMTMRGTFEVKGKNLVMTIDGAESLGASNAAFELKGDKLSITEPNGTVQTYTRK